MNKATITSKLKQQSIELGIQSIGISKAAFLESEAPKLEQWLRDSNQGTMQWMENYFDKRLDPTKLFEGAKSVISFTYNYSPEVQQIDDSYKVSKYAYGKDYHKVFKKKLIALGKWMQIEFGDVNLRAFVDSAPVMDKVWAAKSGLGWIGKHSNLINKKVGSFFFLGEIITDLELDYDVPVNDHCGTCTKCIDACPTDAIEQHYVVNGSKCISYLTIELKEQIPIDFKGLMNDWVFGCDICQDVCPWNSKTKPHNESRFTPKEELMGFTKKEWEEITEDGFMKMFEGSAIKRTGFEGLMRNINFIKKAPKK